MKDHLTWEALLVELYRYPDDEIVLAAIGRRAWNVGTVAEIKATCQFAYAGVPPVVVIGDKHYYALAFGEVRGCPVVDLVEFDPMVWPEPEGDE